jgi:hypothetical protein
MNWALQGHLNRQLVIQGGIIGSYVAVTCAAGNQGITAWWMALLLAMPAVTQHVQ